MQNAINCALVELSARLVRVQSRSACVLGLLWSIEHESGSSHGSRSAALVVKQHHQHQPKLTVTVATQRSGVKEGGEPVIPVIPTHRPPTEWPNKPRRGAFAERLSAISIDGTLSMWK